MLINLENINLFIKSDGWHQNNSDGWH